MNESIAENQFKVDVSSVSGGVNFLIKNTGLEQSGIFTIQFADSIPLFQALTGGTEYTDTGVKFSVLSNNTGPTIPGFNATVGIDRDGAASNAINAGEKLSITLLYADAGSGFADVVSALTSGQLKIGLHAGAFAVEPSIKAVNTPLTAVPVPNAGWAGMALLGCVGAGRTYLRRRAAA